MLAPLSITKHCYCWVPKAWFGPQDRAILICRSRNDEVWQTVTSEVQVKIEDTCKRRGMDCVVQQKTAVPAVHSDTALMEDLRSAILASQEVHQFRLELSK